MNRKDKVMAALAAARPPAFKPADHPDPAMRTRDLQRVLARPRGSQDAAAPTGPVAAPRRRVAAAAVGALLAGAAAATAVVPMLRQAEQDGAPVVVGAQDRPPVDARVFLLAAAARIERQPALTGAWWYQEERTSEVHTFGTGGKSGGGPAYTVEVSQVTRSWFGRSRWRAVTTVDPPRFLTDQDRAAWRAAGSPSLVPGAPPTNRPHPNPSANDSNLPPSFVVGGESLTIDQLRRLPADPGRLSVRLRAAVQGLVDNWPTEPSFDAPTVRALVFQAAADLLTLPVTQAARAAALRVMADTDGAKLSGRISDPAGRAGTGVTFPNNPGADQVFIVEEATATLLATQLVAKDPTRFGVRVPAGTAVLSTTWLETGWTDQLGQRP